MNLFVLGGVFDSGDSTGERDGRYESMVVVLMKRSTDFISTRSFFCLRGAPIQNVFFLIMWYGMINLCIVLYWCNDSLVIGG